MTRTGNGLSPELKSWIDSVIVPALVREYVAEMQREKTCIRAEPVKDSAAIPVSAEGGS